MTVLIAGCGDLGTEAGLRFAAQGHRVVGWRRSPGNLPPGIEGVRADLNTELPRIPADTDVVVIATAASERTEGAYRRAYVSGTSNLLDALARDEVRPRRILMVSSTAVYGDHGGAWVDEESLVDPTEPTARILHEAETLLLSRESSAILLRLSGIYGPGRTRLIDQVRTNKAVLPATPRWTNRIHRDDAAAAIVHLSTAVPSPSRCYLGSDNEPAHLADVLRFLAAELGLPNPASGASAPTRGGDKRCSNALLRSTGFDFAYPTFREGYGAVLSGIGARHR